MRRSRDSGRGLKSTPGFPINPLHAIHSNRKAVSQTATPNRLFHDSQWTPYGTNRRAASHTAPSFHDSQWTPHDLSFHDSQWTLYDAGSTLTSGYVSVATSTEEFPQLPESTSPTEKINPSSFKYPVIQQHYAPSPSKLVETKPSSLASHTVKQVWITAKLVSIMLTKLLLTSFVHVFRNTYPLLARTQTLLEEVLHQCIHMVSVHVPV